MTGSKVDIVLELVVLGGLVGSSGRSWSLNFKNPNSGKALG